jgi:hypothetical protein
VLPAGGVVVGGGVVVLGGVVVVRTAGVVVVVVGTGCVVVVGGTVVTTVVVVVTTPPPGGAGVLVRDRVGVEVGVRPGWVVVVVGAAVVVGFAPPVTGRVVGPAVRPVVGWVVDLVVGPSDRWPSGEPADEPLRSADVTEVPAGSGWPVGVADDAATDGTPAEDAGPLLAAAPFCKPVSLNWSPTRPTAHHAITDMTAAHTAQTITCQARRANPLASINITERLSAGDGCVQVKNMTMT